MIKKLVLVFVAFITIQSYAQQGTASPYSFYGIGSLKFEGTVENRSMGRLSIYTDSIHINLRNPASYATENLNSSRFNGESRPVKYTVGGGFTNLNLKSEASTAKVSSASFNAIFNLWIKSFLLSAFCASRQFAPIDVPDRNN